MGASDFSLARNKPFRIMWIGQLASSAGDQILPIAIVSVAMATSGTAPAVTSLSLIFATRFLALAGFSLLGGVLADRMDKFWLMAILLVIRAHVVLVIVVAGPSTPLWLLVAVTFGLAAGESVFTAANDGVVPWLVSEHQLERANGAISVLRNLAKAIGPAAGGLGVALLAERGALMISIAAFGISAATTIALARMMRHAPAPDAAGLPAVEAQERSSILVGAWHGILVVARLRWLAVLQLMALVQTMLAVGPWFVLTPVITSEQGASVEFYGLLLSSFGIGGVLGGWLAGRIQPVLPGMWGCVSCSLFALPCLALVMTTDRAALLASFALAGLGNQLADVYKVSAIQRQIPRSFVGRALGLDFFVSYALMPLGQLITVPLTAQFDSQSLMLSAAVVVIVTSLLPLLSRDVASLGALPNRTSVVKVGELG